MLVTCARLTAIIGTTFRQCKTFAASSSPPSLLDFSCLRREAARGPCLEARCAGGVRRVCVCRRYPAGSVLSSSIRGPVRSHHFQAPAEGNLPGVCLSRNVLTVPSGRRVPLTCNRDSSARIRATAAASATPFADHQVRHLLRCGHGARGRSDRADPQTGGYSAAVLAATTGS